MPYHLQKKTYTGQGMTCHKYPLAGIEPWKLSLWGMLLNYLAHAFHTGFKEASRVYKDILE